jgi:hypothetical protein
MTAAVSATPAAIALQVAMSTPQLLLGYIIFYSREVIFVMILMQFFMSVLGDQFSELKEEAAGLLARSIPQDVAEHVLPEVKATAKAAMQHTMKLQLFHRLKLARQHSDGTTLDQSASNPALREPFSALQGEQLIVGHSSATPDQQHSCEKLPVSAAALLTFLKAHYSELVASKAFGDRVPAVQVGSRYLDVEALQALLVQLCLNDEASLALLQTGPAREFTRRHAGNAEASGSSYSSLANSSTDTPAGSSTGVQLLPPAGQAAVAAGAPAAAVAAALAAASQLLGSCGSPVDALELQEARLGLKQLGDVEPSHLQQSGDDEEQAGTSLQPGRDYTVEVGAVANSLQTMRLLT